jgi:2-polyprenyl-3-methyl-5-hydroxy-6-metoxy-1,4-benzoquinol methylase
MNNFKPTSYNYGNEYQLKQAQKYINRNNNHWNIRINLARELVERYCLPRVHWKTNEEITVVDIGCSIGTFAIEFAKIGYNSFGIDFDITALIIANKLSKSENVSPTFICGDISNLPTEFPQIDIAICFDIFEHLHDDELGSMLTSIKRRLSENGSIVFHTFPTQYEYIFFSNASRRYPLLPFRFMAPSRFKVLTEIYASLLNVGSLLKHNQTHKERIKYSSHCNPLTYERLNDILKRSGFDMLFFESSNLYKFGDSIQKKLQQQPVTHRNLYGVAVPNS